MNYLKQIAINATKEFCIVQGVDQDEPECEHAWELRSDWGGDNTIPNGTFDASYWYCPKCDEETTEEPAGWEPPFTIPYEDY